MGGVLILLSVAISTLLWMDLGNGYVWSVLIVTLGFGLLGFYDDYRKLTKRSSKGMPSALKFRRADLHFRRRDLLDHAPRLGRPVQIPGQRGPAAGDRDCRSRFLKGYLLDLGNFLFVLFAAVVMVGASNAVNLTDGLDGLAIVPVMIAAGVFGLIAYMAGNAVFSNYLQITFVPGTGELAVFCGSLVGAALGFLWFNAPPAMVFHGRTPDRFRWAGRSAPSRWP